MTQNGNISISVFCDFVKKPTPFVSCFLLIFPFCLLFCFFKLCHNFGDQSLLASLMLWYCGPIQHDSWFLAFQQMHLSDWFVHPSSNLLKLLTTLFSFWDHPFKMSAFFRGKGSKICQFCRRIVEKYCRREGGRGKKS